MNDVAAGIEAIAAELPTLATPREIVEEWFEPDNPRHRNNFTRLGIRRLASEDETWIILPTRGAVPWRPTREAALRLSLARAIRRFRGYARSEDGEGVHWSPEYAGRVIEWARSIAPAKPRSVGWAKAPKRTAWPVGHTVTMTREYPEGREALNVGICQCGKQWKYPVANRHVAMDAAIETHWAQFDGGPMEGYRGDPVSDQPPPAQAKKSRSKQKRGEGNQQTGAVSGAAEGKPATGNGLGSENAAAFLQNSHGRPETVGAPPIPSEPNASSSAAPLIAPPTPDPSPRLQSRTPPPSKC
jgi:hypothetical protein